MTYATIRFTPDGQQITLEADKLARYAVDVGMEQIEKRVHQEMRLPPEIQTDLKVLLTGAGDIAEHAKVEQDLRMD